MTTVVVYESMFGNTKEIAESLATGLAESGQVQVHEATQVVELPDDLELLVVGGPTHAFGMSKPTTRQDARKKVPSGEIISAGNGMREWIATLPKSDGEVAVATFDTRTKHPRLPGSAAKAAHKALAARGYRPIATPETFDVQGMTGPLLPGETERAREWGARLGNLVRTPR